jgi:hypothetical protein
LNVRASIAANVSRIWRSKSFRGELAVNDVSVNVSKFIKEMALGCEGAGTLVRVPTVIEQVEVGLLDAYPVKLEIRVSGYQPDGCRVPVQIELWQYGRKVVVEVYREFDVDEVCPANIVPFETGITLGGEDFISGDYTVVVNDYVLNLTL